MLTWGSGYGEGRYLPAIKHELFGGSAGHAALLLTIPDTTENRELLKECNARGKLKVSYKETIVPERIEGEPPRFGEKKEKAIEIYFSFWGDPLTRPTPERHLMVEPVTDLLGEAEDLPAAYPPIQFFQGEGSENESKKLFQCLEETKKEKQRILSNVKIISKLLLKAKTKEGKDKILAENTQVKDILGSERVESFEKLKEKLVVASAGLKECYRGLGDLGTSFGKPPDSVVDLPINASATSPERALDYKSMLRTMADIANKPHPYNLATQNCSTTAYRCIQAGITPGLQSRFAEPGAKMTSSRFRMPLATPQGVMMYACQLQGDLYNSYGVKEGGRGSFSYRVRAFVSNLIGKIFRPSEHTVLINQRAELSTLIEQTLISGKENSEVILESYLHDLDEVNAKIDKLEAEKSTEEKDKDESVAAFRPRR